MLTVRWPPVPGYAAPGVVDSAPPDNAVALLAQQHAAAGEFTPEAPADEDQDGCAFLALHPLRPLVADRVDAPLDLYVLAVPRVFGVLEVSEEPPRSGVVSSPALDTYTLPFTWPDADSRQCAGGTSAHPLGSRQRSSG